MNKFRQMFNRLIIHIESKGYLNVLSDERYLKLMYKVKKGKRLNLKNPITFNEKLQWLKLYDRKNVYTTMVDKYEAKSLISNIIGEEYIIPTLGIWDKFEDIDFSKLPKEFVLKCTHDSGGVIICKDKDMLDIAEAKSKLEKSLKKNYFWYGREWPYKNVQPRIIAEKFLCESGKKTDDNAITDYKFFCFNGIPKIMYIAKDRAQNPCTDFFDMEFNHLDIRMKDPNASVTPIKPKQFDEMRLLAATLSKGLPHLRVDFYLINERIYVGELTFYHNSGFGNVSPEDWENRLGKWIELPTLSE